MDILIDTNVFIYREYDRVIPQTLQELESVLNNQGHDIIVHPLSKEEIRNDPEEDRREKAESKMETYADLTYAQYPKPTDEVFREHIDEASDFNEQVDNALLYTVHKDFVDFLITEDRGIHKKAIRLGLENRVFTIDGGRDFFKQEATEVKGPPSIEKTKVGNLDIEDPIFDSLKEEYGFVDWFTSIPDRAAYVNWNNDDTLGAILILKPNEVEDIGENPLLGKRERLKICTLKVAENRWGSKMGELLINFAIREAINHENEELYLTHHKEDSDYFVEVIESYGFVEASETNEGEAIFVKRLTPGPGDEPEPVETTRKFYPSFYDGEEVQKYLVPIQPIYHGKLFTTYEKRQPKLLEFEGKFVEEGNAIKKAYLTRANIRQIESGDVLLFYRSHDQKEVTSIGVCESVEYGLTDPDRILKTVGRRSVFTEHEIAEMASRPTTVILFWWHFNLEDPIGYSELRENDILAGPPQTIQQIGERGYKYIKLEGGLDERFTLD